VVLCDLQELSYAEAADALACAVGTVRSRLHRGRQLLASKLSAWPAGESSDASGQRPEGAPQRATTPVGPVKLGRSRSLA